MRCNGAEHSVKRANMERKRYQLRIACEWMAESVSRREGAENVCKEAPALFFCEASEARQAEGWQRGPQQDITRSAQHFTFLSVFFSWRFFPNFERFERIEEIEGRQKRPTLTMTSMSML